MMRDYAEDILNVVLDEIDDIILIHDSEHTLVWMNRAGLSKFKVTLEEIIGKRCYTLFGRNSRCDDCEITGTVLQREGRKIDTPPRHITAIRCPCTRTGDRSRGAAPYESEQHQQAINTIRGCGEHVWCIRDHGFQIPGSYQRGLLDPLIYNVRKSKVRTEPFHTTVT